MIKSMWLGRQQQDSCLHYFFILARFNGRFVYIILWRLFNNFIQLMIKCDEQNSQWHADFLVKQEVCLTQYNKQQ